MGAHVVMQGQAFSFFQSGGVPEMCVDLRYGEYGGAQIFPFKSTDLIDISGVFYLLHQKETIRSVIRSGPIIQVGGVLSVERDEQVVRRKFSIKNMKFFGPPFPFCNIGSDL
jgi:hypothetical protein